MKKVLVKKTFNSLYVFKMTSLIRQTQTSYFQLICKYCLTDGDIKYRFPWLNPYFSLELCNTLRNIRIGKYSWDKTPEKSPRDSNLGYVAATCKFAPQKILSKKIISFTMCGLTLSSKTASHLPLCKSVINCLIILRYTFAVIVILKKIGPTKRLGRRRIKRQFFENVFWNRDFVRIASKILLNRVGVFFQNIAF